MTTCRIILQNTAKSILPRSSWTNSPANPAGLLLWKCRMTKQQKKLSRNWMALPSMAGPSAYPLPNRGKTAPPAKVEVSSAGTIIPAADTRKAFCSAKGSRRGPFFYAPGSGGPERQRHRSAGVFGIVDADGSAQFLRGMLDLPKIIGEGPVEIDPGIPDTDHCILAFPGGFHVDAFVLRAGDGAIQQIPQDESQQVLIRAQFEVPVNLIDDDRFAAYSSRKKSSH